MAGNTNILLESGTNELEIVEFCVNDGDNVSYYGVNVAKVREIIRTPKLTPVLSSPEMVAGMMSLRNRIIPVIDLAKVLGWQPSAEPDKILVLEFNRVTVGILVNDVSRIFRLSWEQVVAPSRLSDGAYVTGLVKMEGRIILVLDFERIIAELCQCNALTPVDEILFRRIRRQTAHRAGGRRLYLHPKRHHFQPPGCRLPRGGGHQR